MQTLLELSGFSSQEQKKHPKAIRDVLQLYNDLNQRKSAIDWSMFDSLSNKKHQEADTNLAVESAEQLVSLYRITTNNNSGSNSSNSSSSSNINSNDVPQLNSKKNEAESHEEIIARMKMICKQMDPHSQYTNFVKIGQGASGGVFKAVQVHTNQPVKPLFLLLN